MILDQNKIILFLKNDQTYTSTFVEPLVYSDVVTGQGGQGFAVTASGQKVIVFNLHRDEPWRNIKSLQGLLHSQYNKEIDVYAGFEVDTEALKFALIALSLTSYDHASLKSSLKQSPKFELKAIDNALVNEANNIANAMVKTMEIVDTPSNIKTPDKVISMLHDIANTYELEIKVLDKEELKKGKFGAITAVGQASKYGSYLAMLSYFGNENSEEIDLAIVGKGVTFDTGGISLKDSSNMHYMKSDIGGAAAAVGGLILIAQQKRPINVMILCPIVENAIDKDAIRPGDVIKAFGGKSIEVIDTDAEGRLILADALSYATQDIKPKYIIDLATLTGNCIQALGTQVAGLFTKNSELSEAFVGLGENSGDRVWPLPMFDEYFEMMHSDIADVKNFHGRPYAGAITAAKFLEYFTNEHPNWVHLDIAGVAFSDVPHLKSKAATGWGVQLLDQFAKYISNK